uniref:Nuclear pore complex protein Nup160 n=1 Tax=Ascaris suum TaxID=6253 RepID=F1KRP3_ASCSU
MADSFGEVELMFAAGYAQAPSRTIRIPNGALRSLESDEAESSAGCFDFGEETAFKDRFIIWRARGPNLGVEERSVECDLMNGTSLCVNFTRAHVVPGTQFEFANGKLVFIVPTQTSLHRFFVQMPKEDPSGIKRSFISQLEEQTPISLYHDCYELTTQGCVSRAAITHSTSDGTTAACHMGDGRIVMVQMHHVLGAMPEVTENVMKGDGFLYRMMKYNKDRYLAAIAPCKIAGQTFFYVLFKDAHLHVYSKTGKTFSDNLPNLFGCDVSDGGELVTAIDLKVHDCGGRVYVTAQLQGDCNSMVLIGNAMPTKTGDYGGLMAPFTTLAVPNVDIIDFAMMSRGVELKVLALCRTIEGRYCVMTATLESSSGAVMQEWEEVSRARAFNAEIDCLMAQRLGPCAMKRSRIFNADNFSFDVVVRSLQLVCKHQASESPFLKLEHNDWKGLSKAVDQYISSPQFDQHHMSREERSLLMGNRNNEVPLKRFWTALQKNCEQLQEAACRPLALWRSNSLGLYGTIQQGRLTVCHVCDEQMEWVRALIVGRCKSKVVSSDALQSCMSIAARFAANEMVPDSLSVEEMNEFSRRFPETSRLIEDVISKFAEMTPVDFTTQLVDMRVPYGGSFTSSLLAASLRKQIDDRLTFSHRLIAFIAVARTVLQTEEFLLRRDTRWDTTLNIHEKTLHNVNRQYTVLSQAAAIRLANGTEYETSLAEAFFSGTGLTAIEGFAHAKTYLDDDMEGEGEDGDDDLEESMRASQWECNSQWSPYSQFLSRLMSSTIVALWPESPALLLPKFLTSGHCYAALLEYCQLNEPYIKELVSAFRFFEGVAYCGLSQPDRALHSFLDALDGMEQHDEALGEVLYALGASSKPPSITEFFLKVMAIMESHNYGEQLVQLGRLALRKSLPDDPLLPTIYTTIFKHELITERFADSLRTLLRNPSIDDRKMCLRELLAKLVDGNQKRALINIDYSSMENQVIDILEGRARAADVAEDGSLYDLLFGFHFKRRNFAKAALAMLEYANRLHKELQNRDILLRRCRCLSVVCQTLALLPEQSRYLAVVATKDNAHGTDSNDIEQEDYDEEVSSGSGHLPAEPANGANKPAASSKSLVLLSLEDITKEAALCDARYAVLEASLSADSPPTVSCIPPSKPEEVFKKLVEKKLFDHAWLMSSIFSIPPYTIIEAVTYECIKVDASSDDVEPHWIAINRRYVDEVGSGKDRHWSIMRSYVEMGRRLYPNDSRILRSASMTFMQYEWPLPCWLSALHQERDVGDFVNILLSFGHLESALDALTKAVESASECLVSEHARSILPYTQIDMFFHLVAKSEDPYLKEISKQLATKLRIYMERVETFSRR